MTRRRPRRRVNAELVTIALLDAPRLPPSGVCEWCGRRRYATEQAALAVVRVCRWYRSRTDRSEQGAYHCHGWWHVSGGDTETGEPMNQPDRSQEQRTAYQLAGWLEEQDIAKGDAATEIAASLAESTLMQRDVAVLLAGGDAPQALRDAAVSLAATAAVDPAEWAADNYWHGHGQLGWRMGQVVND